jgi:hypothetical protein
LQLQNRLLACLLQSVALMINYRSASIYIDCSVSLLSWLKKNERMLMRSPCCLCTLIRWCLSIFLFIRSGLFILVGSPSIFVRRFMDHLPACAPP